MSDDTPWWQILAAPATVSATIAGLVAVWQRHEARRETSEKANLTATERKEAILQAERDTLSKDQREMFALVEGQRDEAFREAKRERERRLDVEEDRDQGWSLARFWYRIAHRLDHALYGARSTANTLAARYDATPPIWEKIEVPANIEDAKGDRQ